MRRKNLLNEMLNFRALAALLVVTGPVSAQFFVEGTNDVSDDRSTPEVLPAGTSIFEGSLRVTPTGFEAVRERTLFSGETVAINLFGVTGEFSTFTLVIDNTGDFADTIAGDPFGNVSDLGSPLGDGFGSFLTGSADAGGNVLVTVTGFPDFGFIGDHSEFGDFTAYIDLNGDFGFAGGDVDYYQFSGLSPNSIQIVLALADLAQADQLMPNEFFGPLLEFRDVSGDALTPLATQFVGDLFALYTIVVPSDGMLVTGVTSDGDPTFSGAHSNAGPYSVFIEPCLYDVANPIGLLNEDDLVVVLASLAADEPDFAFVAPSAPNDFFDVNLVLNEFAADCLPDLNLLGILEQ